MPRMLELIRESLVPHNIVQTAAKGALAVPAAEMIEILVYLATQNKVFGEQASLTLAGWNATSLRSLALDPHAPKEVLDYLVAPQNVRAVLLPALIENLAVSESALVDLASAASREAVEIMLASGRVNLSPPILNALNANPNLSGVQAETIRNKIAPPEPEPEPERQEALAAEAQVAPEGDEVLPAVLPDANAEPENVLDEEIMAYLAAHAAEIEEEGEKPFQPIGGMYEDVLESFEEPLAEAATANAPGTSPATRKRAVSTKKSQLSVTEQRGSALQKISRLDVKGRIQLAMKGSKEERSILVRDGTKVVALAVLESPKITDSEVERYANQKNVLEALLRGIPLKRRFMKHYGIVRNLVSNPRTPLDVSLTLMKNLLINDLKNLSANKEVSDTVRKLATKMYKQKKDAGKK
jgi:hypothetical protein